VAEVDCGGIEPVARIGAAKSGEVAGGTSDELVFGHRRTGTRWREHEKTAEHRYAGTLS
jgi:hypothetical protein